MDICEEHFCSNCGIDSEELYTGSNLPHWLQEQWICLTCYDKYRTDMEEGNEEE